MASQRYYVSLWTILWWLNTLGAASAWCLRRDKAACKADTVADELHCLRQQNSMQTVLDCIGLETGGEDSIPCRDRNQGNKFAYYGQQLLSNPSGLFSSQDIYCMAHGVLMYAHKTVCKHCSVGTVIERCQGKDPSFLNCLCEYHITQEHLDCLSKCFMSSVGTVQCDVGLRRRHESGNIGDGIEPYNAEEMALLNQELELTKLGFKINRQGRPVSTTSTYDPDTKTDVQVAETGLPLPYRDEIIHNGKQLQRCYVVPSMPDLHCRTYSLAQVEGSPSVRELKTRSIGSGLNPREASSDEDTQEDTDSRSALTSSVQDGGRQGMALLSLSPRLCLAVLAMSIFGFIVI